MAAPMTAPSMMEEMTRPSMRVLSPYLARRNSMAPEMETVS